MFWVLLSEEVVENSGWNQTSIESIVCSKCSVPDIQMFQVITTLARYKNTNYVFVSCPMVALFDFSCTVLHCKCFFEI